MSHTQIPPVPEGIAARYDHATTKQLYLSKRYVDFSIINATKPVLPAFLPSGYDNPDMNSNDLSRFSGMSVAVGLSGGVDSSLALALLHEAGAKVSGLTMKIWREGAVSVVPEAGDACYGPGEEEDMEACADLCRSLGVPYQVVDLSEEYEKRILGYFKDEYRAGRTPNPCVRCNRDMKFGFMLEKARAAGADFEYFGTGHYARIMGRQGVTMLRKAVDEPKDQTYFLHRLPPAVLEKVIFPLGGITKAEARELARRYGLAMAEKPESQDFVSGGYSALFDSEEPGDIVDESGTVLGRHNGIVHYTIGQRRGLGIGGGTPLYVASLDAARNRVIVSDDASLFAGGLEGSDAVLHDPRMAGNSFRAQVRIRQNHRPAAATITVNAAQAILTFDQPQRAVAPGQSAVFYDDDGFVLGGCIIDRGTGLPGKTG